MATLVFEVGQLFTLDNEQPHVLPPMEGGVPPLPDCIVIT